MSEPTRDDLRVRRAVDPRGDGVWIDGYDRISAAEFAAIARADGWVKLDGIDAEELREIMADPARLVRAPTLTDWAVLADLGRAVLDALDQEALG